MEYFIIISFCLFGDCGTGWINQPFSDKDTCDAYSTVYSKEVQKRVPESSGEIYCVESHILAQARQDLDMVQLHRLEDLPPVKE